MTGNEVLSKEVPTDRALLKVREAQHELDTFNFFIAEWRMKHGMSPVLDKLYYAIGEAREALRVAAVWCDFDYLVKQLGIGSAEQEYLTERKAKYEI